MSVLVVPKMNSIRVDKKFIGVPFLWEGRSLKGTDCAGMVSLFLEEHGIEIIASNEEYGWKQDPQKLLQVLNRVAKKIPPDISKLKPGDILCFKVQGFVRHVGVYIGYGKFLHVMQLNRSCVSTIDNFWKLCLVGAIRSSEKDDGRVKPFDLEDEVGFVYTALVAIGFAYAAYIAVGIYIMVFAAAAYYMASSAPKANFGMGGSVDGSPRYSTFGALQSTASSDLVVPASYGELKLAGNAAYQSAPGTEVTRCDVFCVGEINSISDIRVNDVPIGEIDGCSVTSYTGTVSQTTDTRFAGSGGRLVPGLRNAAYLALTLKAGPKLNGGFPAVTAVIQGLKVQTWDGTQWTSAKTYSNNPAACIRDFILSSRYGVGVPPSLLDESSFGEVYDYCEVLVDNNEGGTEKRYTLNYIVDSRKPAPDCLSDMLGTFSGWIVWSGTRLKLKVEKAESVIQSFTMNDIIEKSFSYKWSNKDEAVNRIKVQYVDPAQNYTKVFCIAEDKALQDLREAEEGSEGVVEKELSLMGITRFSQASRIASQVLKGIKASPIGCAFKAGIKAIHCEPGDVVAISHDVSAWTNKLFRVAGIQEDENDEMMITCREYNDSVYTDSYGSSIASYQYGKPPNPMNPPDPVTAVTVAESSTISGAGSFISILTVSWTVPSIVDFIQHYLVEYSQDGGSYYSVGTSSGTSIRLQGVIEGSSYVFRVRAVNYNGLMSTAALSSAYVVIGKSALPANVTGFSVSLSGDSFLFGWDANTDADLYGYEIREGSVWATGTLIDTGISNTSLNYKPVLVGTHTFMIKAIDTSDNYSATEDVDTITVTVAPDSNITVDTELWQNLFDRDNILGGVFSGEISFEYMNKYNSAYDRRVMCLRTDKTFGEIEALAQTYQQVQASGRKYGEPLVTGVDAVYTSEVFDVGSVQSAVTSFTVSDENSSVATLVKAIRTSVDNVTWTSWGVWDSATYYYGRYLQVRLSFQVSSTTTNYYIYNVLFSIDVPDVTATDGGNGVIVGVGGTTVYYSRTFTVKPRSLVVSTVDKSSSVVAIISEQAEDSFKCTLYDASDVSVSGSVNYWAKGY